MTGLIGKKLGMTRVFDDDGIVTPVTVIEAGPCAIVQVRETGDSRVVQLGFGSRKAKRASRAVAGHVAKASGLTTVPKVLREFKVGAGNSTELTPGETVTVAMFEPGQRIKITGSTKGRGFQGVVKRHGFRGGPGSHGNTRHRRPGSIGPGTDPSRVLKGKKLPGQMGMARHTEMGLRVVKVDAERNLLFVRGAVPGPVKGIVVMRRQDGKGRYA